MGSPFSRSRPRPTSPSNSSQHHADSAVHAFHSRDTWVAEWQTLMTTNKLVVIDFSASWCGPCRYIEPVFKDLAEKFSDVFFVKIDVDELKDVAREWKVEAMPTFVFVKGGKEVDRLVGADKDELQKKIKELKE